MRTLFVLTVLVAAIGCAKKDDPSAPSHSASAKTAANPGGGNTSAGTPYVAGAGPVSPVHAEGVEGAGGGGVYSAAKDQARRAAGGAGNPAGTGQGGGTEDGN